EVLDITVDGLIGDVNLDGKVNAIDATQILRYCNNKASVFTNAKGYKLELINHNADVDYETGINAVDATQILRYCNNKPNTVAR
ncbi:MAG: dockerin type I repeat-containing protein, partial [Eubacteriaceae bacterium]|nr:dockerin type I repeat-containing protein [Eubacteriaceae bacterium]